MKRIKKYISWFLLALLLTLMVAGITAFPATARLNIANYMPELVDYTLPNGLRVILAKDNSAPVVAVDMLYSVGGANDPEKRSGFAHLFEHIMFNGSENVAKGKFDEYLESIGGDSNAATDTEYTEYYEKLPAAQLPLALWLESDRMASLKVDRESFNTERQVVIQELKERLNAAYGRTQLYFITTPFRGYLPYERTPIGNINDLNAATLEDVKEFHRQYYIPNNAILSIAGDIDFEQTKALVEAYFGEIPPGETVVPILDRYPLPKQFPVTKTDPKTGCKIGYEDTVIDPLIELPAIYYTVVAPPSGDRDFYALSLLTNILSAGESSRFQQEIIRQGLASSASVGIEANMGASIFWVSGTPNANESIASVQSLLQKQLKEVMTKGVTEAELNRAKKSLEIGAISGLRSSVLTTASILQHATYQFGSPQAIVKDIENFDAVTIADIQQVAKTYLCQKPMNKLITLKSGREVLATYPGKLVKPIDVPINSQPLKTSSITSEELAKLPAGVVSRTQPPKPLPAKEIKFPPYQTFSLNNGLKAIFVEHHEVPELQLELFVGGSDVAVPANKQGVTSLLADVITQGTKNSSGIKIAERIESVGGSLSAEAELEDFTVSTYSPSADAQVAFDTLADVVLNPTFPQPAFDVAKSQMLTALVESETDPSWLAERQLYQVAYPDHPYGFITSTKTVNKVTRSDLVNFHNTFFKPNNALLAIVGDISLEQAKAEAQRVFGNWQPGQVPNFLAYPTNRIGDTSVIYLIDRVGSEQATIRIGNLSLDAANPDDYALEVVNTVLGDGTTGRLFKNLRVQKGYTYSIESELANGSHDIGTFVIATDVNQKYTGDAVREILKELQTIRTQLIPDSEFSGSKGKLLGSFDLGLEDPFDVVGELAGYQLLGLPLQEYENYRQEIDRVTKQDALKAAAKYISSEPIIVVVGDASVVKPQLDKLGKVVQVDSPA